MGASLRPRAASCLRPRGMYIYSVLAAFIEYICLRPSVLGGGWGRGSILDSLNLRLAMGAWFADAYLVTPIPSVVTRAVFRALVGTIDFIVYNVAMFILNKN